MNLDFSPQFWNMVSSIATTLGFLIIIFSAFIAVHSLKEMRNARYLEAMLNVYSLIGSEEMHKMRKHIYNKLPSEPDKLKEEDIRVINEISSLYDRIGTLVKHKLVPKEFILDSHHAIFIKIWNRLKPHIEYRRKTEIVKYHVKNFEWWAKECEKQHLKTLKSCYKMEFDNLKKIFDANTKGKINKYRYSKYVDLIICSMYEDLVREKLDESEIKNNIEMKILEISADEKAKIEMNFNNIVNMLFNKYGKGREIKVNN